MREVIRIIASGEVARRTNGQPVVSETSYTVPEGRVLRLSRVTCGSEYSIHEARVEVLLVVDTTETVIGIAYTGTVQFSVDIEATAGQQIKIRRKNGDPTELHMTGVVEGILL